MFNPVVEEMNRYKGGAVSTRTTIIPVGAHYRLGGYPLRLFAPQRIIFVGRVEDCVQTDLRTSSPKDVRSRQTRSLNIFFKILRGEGVE